MDSKGELCLRRARTEMHMANLLFRASSDRILNTFDIPEEETFYSGAISHSYYAIFYSARHLNAGSIAQQEMSKHLTNKKNG